MSERIVPPGGNAPSKADSMSASLSSWIHFFHQPYKSDWKEARIKAIDRKWKYEIFKKGGYQ